MYVRKLLLNFPLTEKYSLPLLVFCQQPIVSVYRVSDKFSGGLGDWARGVAGINDSFEIELRDRGRYGFLLPVSYIEPVGEEMWSAVQVLASHVVTNCNRTQLCATQVTSGVSGLRAILSLYVVIMLTSVIERLTTVLML